MRSPQCECGLCRNCLSRRRYREEFSNAALGIDYSMTRFERKLARYRAAESRRRSIRVRRTLVGARQSKRYTRSRRSLVQAGIVAAKTSLGLKANEPFCHCGTCSRCKDNQSRRKARKERSTGFYWDSEISSPSIFELELARATSMVQGR